MAHSSVQYLHSGLIAPTTVVTSKSSQSLDSGHPPVPDPLTPGDDANNWNGEGAYDYVISLTTDKPAETPTKAAAMGEDIISLGSNILPDFDSEKSQVV